VTSKKGGTGGERRTVFIDFEREGGRRIVAKKCSGALISCIEEGEREGKKGFGRETRSEDHELGLQEESRIGTMHSSFRPTNIAVKNGEEG